MTVFRSNPIGVDKTKYPSVMDKMRIKTIDPFNSYFVSLCTDDERDALVSSEIDQ